MSSFQIKFRIKEVNAKLARATDSQEIAQLKKDLQDWKNILHDVQMQEFEDVGSEGAKPLCDNHESTNSRDWGGVATSFIRGLTWMCTNATNLCIRMVVDNVTNVFFVTFLQLGTEDD